jgi:amino acid transporter
VILDWIYNNPTWLWGTVVVLALDGAACLGLVLFHRLIHVEVRRAHNELTGFIVAVISVTYAVLLAFIAIATWESFTQSEDIVDREADAVGSIYRDTLGLAPETAQEIRSDIRVYTDSVINQEWPIQQAGEVPTQGWEPLRKIHSAIVMIHPANAGEAVLEAELLKTLNTLYSARGSRLSAVQGHIPEVIWWVIFFGGALTTGFTFIFGFHDIRMHLLTTAAVSTSLALVVVLIIALDWPFRGKVSVSPEAFVTTEQSWNDLSFQPSGAPQPMGAVPSFGAGRPRMPSR